MLETTRKKEEEIKKQTSEQLDLFRRQQEEADKAAIEGDGAVKAGENSPTGDPEEKWIVNRGKRKRPEDKKSLPFKLRRSSSTQDGGVNATSPPLSPPTKATAGPQATAKSSSSSNSAYVVLLSKATKPSDSNTKSATTDSLKLGLAGYSSDED